ncbi:cation diffusion facilitator family transporter [Clostridium beijerinckii]|uniref:Cation diffusion facilitator family transporter n=1 Tax=Clostridium beijerinckii TaxID=1520 RepID=A0AAX0B6G1_CLOBE|nr:cation diffusion facilitator family transporter [Clostridium beijerinckii]MBA8932507.1 cation diffusion facilitator family transporter [Clostridium beijerinckii]NRT37531.1 cation diffusion facilitator family transporter [Clostridium beijerinckii]NRT48727.1 cation diffusion facilitator family transporter [Clostridium beijerinckii]NRT74212.1 cation diffusion facilitator family transporter [Clostridium beijerinckii]NRT90769.1 cation diffusion facilitator family transporter [Clostridium beijeri
MFFELIVNKFVKDNSNVKDDTVRNSYGVLGGIIGIVVNIILFIIKLSVGVIVSSIAIMADAFNNLSDAASSLITILGFKLSNKPADREHPFGHGRIEYLSALIVAFMVMLVGLQFIKSSFERIVNPSPVAFELVSFILLIVSIFFKIWLSKFNKFIGEKINSSALKAASTDALGDVFTTTCVAISFLASKFTSFPIDGYIGMFVALFIVYAGFNLVKDTINPLLGEAPDPELVESIEKMVLSYDNILGSHDLIIHNYGPGKCMASIHAEIPGNINVVDIHEVIDKAEREISKALKIYLVIHIDPICVIEGEVKEAYDEILSIIEKYDYIESIHDFRVVGEGDIKNLIFDVVIEPSKKLSITDTELINIISEGVKKYHPSYNCVITIDKHYT